MGEKSFLEQTHFLKLNPDFSNNILSIPGHAIFSYDHTAPIRSFLSNFPRKFIFGLYLKKDSCNKIGDRRVIKRSELDKLFIGDNMFKRKPLDYVILCTQWLFFWKSTLCNKHFLLHSLLTKKRQNICIH